MNRRNFLTLLGAAPAFAAAGGASAQGYLATADLSVSAAPVWEAWKEAYLRADGRVVDGLQHNASHSEGQGYGALLATEFNDLDAFARIVEWSEMNLAVRGDGLLAWRYLPEESNRVPDLNNASDGDLFYAWAMVRAATRFDDRSYLGRAQITAAALVDRCVVDSMANPAEKIFLPAAQGFVHADRQVFNPCYIMPLALRELAAATGVVELAQVAQHAEAIMQRVAVSGPVPDWLQVTASGIGPADGFSTAAGYEAMRIPLYLIWSGLKSHPAVTQMMRVYEQTVLPGAPVPTRIEPSTGAVLEASNDPGYRALAALINCTGNPGSVGSDMPAFDPTQPYYPATLQMFAMIAANQVSPECVPI
ncbi:glycosyl hydrolase family 8 [Pararhodobacter zhoushanensis]|uniref:glycosyl hydrolase family 8 n=1 Tax=Pararhodobacter zhoushanensis TaxID=2479545 RepID=UPI000F8C6AB6|nr:glycosyl hydrolase family 8 [Pararhodobacter zhoushanensis]